MTDTISYESWEAAAVIMGVDLNDEREWETKYGRQNLQGIAQIIDNVAVNRAAASLAKARLAAGTKREGESVPGVQGRGMPDAVEIVEVIVVKGVRGSGKREDDRCRHITQVWSKKGALIAEHDPCIRRKEEGNEATGG